MSDTDANVKASLRAARRAQTEWQATPLRRRLDFVGRLRHLIVEHADQLAASVDLPSRGGAAETLSAEVVPLADACRFLQQRAERILAPRRLGRRGRPIWLWGTRFEVHREPFGVVLILAPWNYPLLLPGVQAIQALVAGNAVLIKPRLAVRAAETLVQLIHEAGIDPNLCVLLPESIEAAKAAIDEGVDRVLLTGSASTGRAVLGQLADHLTPATMELSGCDAVIVRADADLDRVARAVLFGLRLNSGATCIAPRRVFVHRSRYRALLEQLTRPRQVQLPLHVDEAALAAAHPLIADAIRQGARPVVGRFGDNRIEWPLVLADAHAEMELLRADVFVPVAAVAPVDNDEAALEAVRSCPYGLGAAVFGDDRQAAYRLAQRLPAGFVTVGDLIVPTVDPRVPFGGRGASGFGTTRGLEGLLELTTVKVIAVRRTGWLPHLDAFAATDQSGDRETPDANAAADHIEPLMRAYLKLAHGRSLGDRARAIGALWRAARTYRRRQ